MKKLKTVDLSKPSFMANGHEYFIDANRISLRRWKEYEKLGPRISFGIDFERMFAQLNEAFNALNGKNIATASVIIHNVMSGVKDILDEKRVHPSLMMCALLINRKDEDPGEYSERMMLEKISDWEEEGLDVMPFFSFALKSINGLRETYLKLIADKTETILKKNKTEK